MIVALSERVRRLDPVRRLPMLVSLVGLALTAIYVSSYVGNPAVPGNHGRFPLGWWGWWDQSQYLLSARSFAHADFSPAHHWYPPGYSVFGAPFLLLSASHPYLLPDLACLLASYAGFLLFARTVGVGPRWAALLFLLATCGSEALRDVWAEPWNTSLSSALIWWLLALTARHLAGDGIARRGPLPAVPAGVIRRRRLSSLAGLGALAAIIPFTRPTDGLLVAIWAAGAGLAAIRLRALRTGDLLAMLASAVVVAVPEALLWLRIYGTHESQYMINSRSLGFEFASVGWKTYLLLLTPRPWFPFGAGLVQRLPWILPGLAGMLALPWISRGPARMMLGLLALMIAAYSLLFFSYVDLIPSGLWRYNNVHYFKWTLPGVALFGFLLLRALLVGPRRPALLACLPILFLADLRLQPHRVGDADPAWMIQLHGPVPGWDEAYFTKLTLQDDRGRLQPIKDFRALSDGQGWRLIALRRPFSASLAISGLGHWPDGPVSTTGPSGTATRWDRSFGLKLPCWMIRCVYLPP